MYTNKKKTAKQSKNRKGTHESDETSYNTVIVVHKCIVSRNSIKEYMERVKDFNPNSWNLQKIKT